MAEPEAYGGGQGKAVAFVVLQVVVNIGLELLTTGIISACIFRIWQCNQLNIYYAVTRSTELTTKKAIYNFRNRNGPFLPKPPANNLNRHWHTLDQI